MSRYPHRFSRLNINYPEVLELTLSQSQFSAATHSINFHSTWYPLLLGGQKQRGFKAYPKFVHMTSNMGIEPQYPLSQVASTTRPQFHNRLWIGLQKKCVLLVLFPLWN